MAIVQISRITHRKGLSESLPQLAGAELGWCIDTRQLYIGNGTLDEGAPIIGNTELLTEFSDISDISKYIYKDETVGYVAQTGPSTSQPVVRTVQDRLDDIATVRGYGAIGDGTTDDTAAINRALFDLYCRDNNPKVRRALYFPAGQYRITGTIIIPTYAKLVGEGAESTIFVLDAQSPDDYVARTADATGEIGPNMGVGDLPRNIEISGMTISSNKYVDLFLVENAVHCNFDNVIFRGAMSLNDLIPDPGISYAPPDIAAVRFSSINVSCSHINFTNCAFTGITSGFSTSESALSVTVTGSRFERLFNGVVLGRESLIDGGPRGWRITGNTFDEIFAQGIIFDRAENNVSAHNMFYDVANGFTGSPEENVIYFGNENNVSFGDMFSRTDFENNIELRVGLGTQVSSRSSVLQLGHLTQVSGKLQTITNGLSDQTIAQINSALVRAFSIEYTIVRNNAIRHGKIIVSTKIVGDANSTLTYIDDYVENQDPQVDIVVEQVSNTTVAFKYSAVFTGNDGILTYSIRHLA